MATNPRDLGNEPQRHDPELRQQIQQVLDVRKDAIQEAYTLVQQAADILTRAMVIDDDALYNRMANSVSRAEYTIRSNMDYVTRDHTDIYLGNMAVGQMGEHILELGPNEMDRRIGLAKERLKHQFTSAGAKWADASSSPRSDGNSG